MWDALNYSKAEVDKVKDALEKTMAWVRYYNSAMGRVVPSLKVPDYVIKPIKEAHTKLSGVSKVAGYAVYLRNVQTALSEISRLPQPPPPRQAAIAYGRLLVLVSVMVKSLPIPFASSYGDTIEVFGNRLESLVTDTFLHGSSYARSGYTPQELHELGVPGY